LVTTGVEADVTLPYQIARFYTKVTLGGRKKGGPGKARTRNAITTLIAIAVFQLAAYQSIAQQLCNPLTVADAFMAKNYPLFDSAVSHGRFIDNKKWMVVRQLRVRCNPSPCYQQHLAAAKQAASMASGITREMN
jgi:hypothetical protein